MDIAVDIAITENFTVVKEKLEAALSTGSLLEWMRQDAIPHLQERAAARFAREGDDASGQWALLSAYTIADRIRRGYGPGPIEHRTGELERFITSSQGLPGTGPGVSMEFPGASPSGVLGIKFAVAQRGSRRNGTPARRVVALSDADAQVLTYSLGARIASLTGL